MFDQSEKVAVASKDGIAVNLHFGHAHTFWIYQRQGSHYQFLEKRDVDQYCLGHFGDQQAMQKILTTVKDCKAVFSAKIGDSPAKKLENIGVQSVSDYAYESIEEALAQYLGESISG